MCICLLSSPRGSEHVPGPVSGGCHQPLPVAGEFSESEKGRERHGRDRRRLGLGMGVGEEEYALEAMLIEIGLCFQACGPTAQRACAKNMYAKGSCLLLGSSLQVIRAVPATMPGGFVEDEASGEPSWRPVVGELGLLLFPFWRAACGLGGALASPRSEWEHISVGKEDRNP